MDLEKLELKKEGSSAKIYKKDNVIYKIGDIEQKDLLFGQYELLKELNDSHFISVYKWIEDSSLCGFSMEEITGVKIDDVFSKPPKRKNDFKRLKKIIINILDGLRFLHNKSIIHGDLKPSHIYIYKDNNIKMIDPGFDPDILTPAYASPEAITGEPSETSDIYSLGIILYEIVTDREAFTGNLGDIIEAKFERELPLASEINKSVPEEMDILLQRMISRDIETRLHSVSDVLRELELGSPEMIKDFSIIPVFTDRKKEIEYFNNLLKDKEKSHIIWITGGPGAGKSRLLNQFRIKSLIEGLRVFEFSAKELDEYFREKREDDEYLILLVDEQNSTERVKRILERNSHSIENNRIVIIVALNKEVELSETLKKLSVVFHLSNLKKRNINEIIEKNFPAIKNKGKLSSYLIKRTNGIPELINNTLSYLLKSDVIERKDEEWYFKEKDAASIDFPSDTEGFFEFQIKNLSGEEREFLRSCSIFPGKIPAEFIHSLDIENPYILIESLLSRGFFIRDDGMLSIHNRWTRDYLYQTLNKSKKKMLYSSVMKSKVKHPEVLHDIQIDLGMKEEAFISLWKMIKSSIKEKDYKSATDFLVKALSIKRNKKWEIILGRLYEIIGSYKDAVNIYKLLHNDEPDNIFLLLKLAACERRTGEEKKAEDYLKKAVSKTKGLRKQKAVYELSRLYIDKDRIEEGKKLIKECKGKLIPEIKYLKAIIEHNEARFKESSKLIERILKSSPSKYLRMMLLNLLGLNEQKMENYESSIEYFDECISICRELNNRIIEAMCLCNKGSSLLRLDRYRIAVRELEKSLSILRDAGMFEQEGIALKSLSIIYLRMGYWGKIEDRIDDFRKRSKSIKTSLKEKVAYARMYKGEFRETGRIIDELKKEEYRTDEIEAIMASFKGEWIKAEKLFRQVLDDSNIDERRKRETVCRLSEVLFYRGKRDEAGSVLKPYMSDLKSIDSDFERANLLSIFGFVSDKFSYLEDALKLFQKLALPFYMGRTRIRMGDNLIRENRTEEAVESLRNAEEIFEKLGSKPYLERVRELLSKCAGKLVGRSGYIRTYNELSDLLSSIDSDERFDEALSILTGFFNAERGAIILKEKDRDVIISSYKIDKTTLEDATRISSTVTSKSAEGEIIISGDAGKDERFRNLDSVNRNRIRSILCVPITAEDRVYGSLYLDSTVDKDIFLPRDKEFLRSLGKIIGIMFSKGDILYILKQENIRLKRMTDYRDSFHSIIGVSQPMQDIYRTIEEVAPMDVNVLITGETGTGKEMVAMTIHKLSDRKNHPFVTVDCSSLNETLLQSELFGHKKGSFTGAVEDKMGMCEKANGGTLFLDEVGDAPLSIQAGLLHVTDRGEIRRVGDTDWRKVDLRIIAATNKDLERGVTIKEFRNDLYYRLNHVTINLSPLREKGEDIPLIAEHYLKIFADKKEKNVRGFTEKAMNLLTEYPWPGNVRELKNTVEVALLRCRSNCISRNDLPDKFKEGIAEESLEWEEIDKDLKREAVLRALDEMGGNKSKAAEKLNISRRHLYRLLKKLHI